MTRASLFTLQDFAAVFAPLAIQLRQTDADETTIRVYYAALSDLELPFLAMAAERLAHESAWFPKTSEWRLMAARIEAERLDEQRALLRRLHTPLCLDCDDSGWTAAAADGHTRRVVRCACQALRRAEVLGQRPWPVLPTGPGIGDGALTVGQSATALAQLRRRGFRVVVKGMPAAPATAIVVRDEACP
jgi:hypothetical protein